MRILLPVALVLVLAAHVLAADLQPFVLPWDDDAPGPTDLRFLDPRPAGAAGPITVGADGHLYAGKERICFFGVNSCFGASFPDKPAAVKVAGRMAKFGINAVRFHHMDGRRFPDGILSRSAQDTRALDPEALDRLDYFIAQLERRGIYADLNLLVARQFTAADGLPPAIDTMDWKDRHVVGFFSDPVLALQKEYARNLLTHRNAYTHLAYAQDPAVAFVEINNENGLAHAWLDGKLDALPPVFAAQLREKWNAWLRRRYIGKGEADTTALKRAWGDRNQPAGNQMLVNADLVQGPQHWVLEQHGGAEARMSVEQGATGDGPAADEGCCLRVAVTRLGTAGWHVQVSQMGLALEKGHLYTLSFRAKAEPGARILAGVREAHAPWGDLGLSAPVELGGTWRAFTWTFIASADDADARINFTDLGAQKGVYEFGDLSLRPGGAVGLTPKETLQAGTVPCQAHDGTRAWSDAARRDWVRFLWETERDYWQAMRGYIKQDLHYPGVVVGTIVGTSTPNLMAGMDAIDSHAYWQHPHFPGRPWDMANWTVENQSMVNATPGGVLAPLAWQQVEGRPHLVTEYNHAAPNSYASEAPLLLAAVAGLQDWDGVFLFDYSARAGDWDTRYAAGFFDIDQSPTKMANVAEAAALFRRGDLSPAKEQVVLPLSREAELALIPRGDAWAPITPATLGVPVETPLLHRTALQVGDAVATAGAAGDQAAALTKELAALAAEVKGKRRFVADTGQLVWDASVPGKGLVTIDTPRTKALIGFADGRTVDLSGVILTPDTPGMSASDKLKMTNHKLVTPSAPWCTLALTLLDGNSFHDTCRALLVATGDAENTGMHWTNARKNSVGRDWGHAPSLVEVVPATIELPVPAGRVQAWALDEHGQRGSQLEIGAEPGSGYAVIRIGPPERTLWYEIVVK